MFLVLISFDDCISFYVDDFTRKPDNSFLNSTVKMVDG